MLSAHPFGDKKTAARAAFVAPDIAKEYLPLIFQMLWLLFLLMFLLMVTLDPFLLQRTISIQPLSEPCLTNSEISLALPSNYERKTNEIRRVRLKFVSKP